MKKLLLAALAIGSVFTASAQSKTTFGISGGVNFAHLDASISGSSATASSGTLTSFSAGVFADAPLGTHFSIQPGLYYTGKGGSPDHDGEDFKVKLNYLQVPVPVVYNVPVSAGKFFFGAGPYAAYGLSAKAQADSQGSADLKFGQDIKHTDFGATGLVGFSLINGLMLKANYDLGLTNILDKTASDGVKNKNRVFGISVGYTF